MTKHYTYDDLLEMAAKIVINPEKRRERMVAEAIETVKAKSYAGALSVPEMIELAVREGFQAGLNSGLTND